MQKLWHSGVRPPICSHTRAGVHYLAELLLRNLHTGATDREELHYSHSRRADVPYLHLYRACLPTMVSVWRCREHLGVAKEVSFARMLREPWSELPKSVHGNATYDGIADGTVCARKPFVGTAPEQWLKLTREFAEHALLTVDFDDALAGPLGAVEAVAKAFGLRRKFGFLELPSGKVGWQPLSAEQPNASRADIVLLEGFQLEYDA